MRKNILTLFLSFSCALQRSNSHSQTHQLSAAGTAAAADTAAAAAGSSPPVDASDTEVDSSVPSCIVSPGSSAQHDTAQRANVDHASHATCSNCSWSTRQSSHCFLSPPLTQGVCQQRPAKRQPPLVAHVGPGCCLAGGLAHVCQVQLLTVKHALQDTRPACAGGIRTDTRCTEMSMKAPGVWRTHRVVGIETHTHTGGHKEGPGFLGTAAHTPSAPPACTQCVCL